MDPAAFQAAFFRKLSGAKPLMAMFDALGLAFTVKDVESRVVCASRPVLEKFGMSSESKIVGTTDRDRYPARMAEVFRKSDREVVESGRPVLGRLEVWYNAEGALDWCTVTKLPLRDGRGKVVGVMMAMRPWRGAPRELGASLGGVVERIRRAPGEPHRVSTLAREAGMSARQLQRRFGESFGVGVKEFILRARIQAAAEALRSTSAPIAEVALDSGFYDQSAFTRQFRRRTGLTPQRYRRQGGGTR